jgi:2-polyprenyl-3-methyl-5-hydroxy-6-metoxy-1,4-benzoquinol methylase
LATAGRGKSQAVVTGLDFSSAALDFARRLADETGLKANFVQGMVDEAPHLTPGPLRRDRARQSRSRGMCEA